MNMMNTIIIKIIIKMNNIKIINKKVVINKSNSYNSLLLIKMIVKCMNKQ